MAAMQRGDDPFAVVMAALSDGEEFQQTWQGPFRRAIRLHPRRGTAIGWGKLTPIPWNPKSYFTDPTCDPGDFLNYHTGTIYPQDAASQVPVLLLNPQPGETIIDVCAAPGSKSTQIGLSLNDNGLLICCDAAAPRRKIIAENLGRQGITCGVVTPMPVHVLSERHRHVADGVLVDVPCSGHEFRSAKQVVRMAERQLQILQQASQLVAGGGRLVYSTCTPYQAENEEVIARFLEKNPAWATVPVTLPGCDSDLAGLGAIRLWPQRQGTEPFFACLLSAPKKREHSNSWQGTLPNQPAPLARFLPENTKLHAWQHNTTQFVASRQAACCALPSEARGLVLGRDDELSLWAAQALITCGVESVTVTHQEALTLWSGESLELNNASEDNPFLCTETGAPLGRARRSANGWRLQMPSRLSRSQLK